MGLNIYQTFVQSNSQDEVKATIDGYVAIFGAKMVVDPKGDKPNLGPYANPPRRYRDFILSPPRGGMIAIWENGSWADRRLTQYLSKELQTVAHWIIMNDVTDSGGYFTYQDGRLTASKFNETGRHWTIVEKYGKKHGLPYLFKSFPDPYIDDYDEEVEEIMLKTEMQDEYASAHGLASSWELDDDEKTSQAFEKLFQKAWKKFQLKNRHTIAVTSSHIKGNLLAWVSALFHTEMPGRP